MFKSSIWLMGLVLFLITHSRLASPSAILEYRSTVVPDIEEIKALERSKEITSGEIQSLETHNPPIPGDTDSEPALVGEYYDAPEAVLTEPEYIVVDTSNPESIEVALADEHTLVGYHEVSLENSKIFAVLSENSHASQETPKEIISAGTEILDAPAQIESAEEIPEVADSTEEPNTVVVEYEPATAITSNEEPHSAIEENDEPHIENAEEIPEVLDSTEEPNTVVVEYEATTAITSNEEPHSVLIEETEEPHVVIEENEEPHVVIEENEEPHIVVEENEESDVVTAGNTEPGSVVEENEEPALVVPEENTEGTSVVEENEEGTSIVEENEEGTSIVEENEVSNAVIIDVETLTVATEEPSTVTEENEEGTSIVEENDESNAVIIDVETLTVATEEPSTVTEEDGEPNATAEATEGPPTVSEVSDVREYSEEQSNEEEPNSAEKALEKEVNDIIAAMAAKNELGNSESTETPLEETEPEAVQDENILVASPPSESNSKEIVIDTGIVENELTGKDENENTLENTVIIFEDPSPTESLVPDVSKELSEASEPVVEESAPPEIVGEESLMSKVLAMFSTQATPEQSTSSEIAVEVAEKDGALDISPTALENLITEPLSEESDGSGTFAGVINKVILMKRVLLAFSTQSTPEENNPDGEIVKLDSAEIISESNPTEPAIIDESVIEDGPSTLSQVFNKVRLMTKVLSMFSTQATPEENGSAEAILENSSSEPVLDQNPIGMSAEETSPTEIPLTDSIVPGSSVEIVDSSEVSPAIPETENEVKTSELEETLSGADEPTTLGNGDNDEQEVAAAILPAVESSEEISPGDENAVAGPLESSEKHSIVAISSSEDENAEKPVFERDAGDNPVVFEADEDSKRNEISGENENRIQYMESKMTVTFVNDGDDYANDAVEGTIAPIIAPEDDDSEEDASPGPDADEEIDGEVTETPIVILKASSGSSSSESNENSTSSSESDSTEDKLELPLPGSTDAAETGSAPAPEINSDESDEDVSTTPMTNAEADDAETVDDGESNETKEKSVSEKILNAVVDDLINAVAGKSETVDNTDEDVASSAALTTFDRTTVILGGVLMCLSFMSFQEF